MTAETQTADGYRLRAEELRTLAEMDIEMRNRDTLCGIAESYDRMANSIDAITESRRVLARAFISN